MEIKRVSTQPSSKGPAEWFTGSVRIDPLFQANNPARAAGASVTFEPGARTAWHTHPLGQTLIIMAGSGRVQREGGPVEEVHPGDVVRPLRIAVTAITTTRSKACEEQFFRAHARAATVRVVRSKQMPERHEPTHLL
jgi:Cupin domain